HRISDAFRIELNGPHGIVVAGNDVIDVVRRAIRVDHRYDGNAELLGFAHRNALMTDVDHEQDVRQRLHVANAAEAALQLVALAAQPERLALAVLLEQATLDHLVELDQALDGLPHRLEIGEHAAQPTMTHVRHTAA